MTALDPSRAARLEDCAARIEAGARLTTEGVIAVGQALLAARREFGEDDRGFGRWRASRLPWLGADTALNLQRVAARFGALPKNSAVTKIARTVLYELAAPATPPEIVEGVLELAETGQKITLADVRAMQARIQKLETPALARIAPAIVRDLTKFEIAAWSAGPDETTPETWIALRDSLERALAAVDRLSGRTERMQTTYSLPALEHQPEPETAPAPASEALEAMPKDRLALAAIGHRSRADGERYAAIAGAWNAAGWTPAAIPKPGARPRSDAAAAWTDKTVAQLLTRDYPT